MTLKQWLNLVLTRAALAALPVVPTFAAAQPAPAAAESATDIARREAEQQRQILMGDGSTDQRSRDEAAKRLLQAGRVDLLSAALGEPRDMPQLAVARAVADSEAPPNELYATLERLLPTRSDRTPEMVEAVAQAIANYKDRPGAIERLRGFVAQGTIPPRLRVRAVRALGTVNDKETAYALVNLLEHDVSPLIADAAADALAEMTGRTEFGNDASQWAAWWDTQKGKTDAEFRADRLRERSGDLGVIRRQAAETLAAIERATIEAIRLIPPGQARDEFLLGRLRDASPLMRTAGASVVLVQLRAGAQIAPALVEQLRTMVGDSNRDVRLQVAQAIRNINDPGAVRPILAQLHRERDPQVKAALLDALAPTKDVTAAPELIQLVDDPATPFRVAEAAAGGLKEMGGDIALNPELARQTSNALARAFDRTVGKRAPRLRERLIDAMVPLRDPGLIQLLLGVQADQDPDRTTPATRVNAIRALAGMRSAPMQSLIAQGISRTLETSRDAGVRLEAAAALGIVGGPENGKLLLEVMQRDADAGVRDAAGKSLNGLFPKFEWAALRDFANQPALQNDPPLQAIALDVVVDKLDAAVAKGAPEEATLAAEQERLGTLYLDRLDQPAKAARLLRAAYNYNVRLPGGTVERIQVNLIRSYLGAGQFKDAVDFANERIAQNPANEETMGRAFVRNLEELRDKNLVKPAMDLLEEIKRLRLTPQKRYFNEIADLDKMIRSRQRPALDRWLPFTRPTRYA